MACRKLIFLFPQLSPADHPFRTGGEYYTTVTTTVDASPLSALPTGLPTLPTGTFSLNIGTSLPGQALCLADSTQTSAWSCAMPPSIMQVTVTSLGSLAPNISNNIFSLFPPKDTLKTYSYGTQPPVFDPRKVMTLVRDYDDPHYGPAWFFQVTYNKLVVLPEDALSVPSTSSSRIKRGRYGFNSDEGFLRRGVAQAGDTPWFCYWNGTLLEAFVYANATSDAGEAAMSSLLTASTSTPTTFPAYGAGNAAHAPTVVTATTNTTPSPTASLSPLASVLSQMLPAYPKIIKLEERRMPPNVNYDHPYCVKMSIGSDGMMVSPVLDDDGNTITINLTERASGNSKRGDGELVERDGKLVNRDLANECHCSWMMD